MTTKSKAAEAYDYLKKLIDSDQYQPGDKLPTEVELNQTLGINRQTVAKALASLKSEGYIERIAGRGTTLLRKPSAGLCKTILLVSPWQDWNTRGMWYYRTLSYAIQVEAMQSGHSVLNTAFHALEADEREINKIRTLYYTNDCSGVIIIDPFTSTREDVQNMIDQIGCPAVWAGSGLRTGHANHQVDIDNFQAAKELTSRLIADGAKKIIFMSGALNTTARQRRFDGYRSALEEHGLPFDEQHVITHGTAHLHTAGSECAALYAARWLNADAIFLNDVLMIEGIHRFCDHYPSPQLDNLKTLPIATFDYAGKTQEPNIRHSIIQPVEEIGKLAVQTLLRVEKEKPSKPIVKVLPHKLQELS